MRPGAYVRVEPKVQILVTHITLRVVPPPG